jgi:hypothetical protein
MNLLSRSFGLICATPCWQVRWDHQVGLDMSFGAPSLEIREPLASSAKSPRVRRLWAYRNVSVHGEWWLWVTSPRWKLSLADDKPVTRSSTLRRIQQAIGFLDGQKFTSVELDQQTGFTRFSFDLGAVLEVRREDAAGEQELWTLHQPNGYALGVRGDGCYSYERLRHPDRWRRFPASRTRRLIKACC